MEKQVEKAPKGTGLRSSVLTCQILLSIKQDATRESLVAVELVWLVKSWRETPVPAASDESKRLES